MQNGRDVYETAYRDALALRSDTLSESKSTRRAPRPRIAALANHPPLLRQTFSSGRPVSRPLWRTCVGHGLG